jgi:cold-inducible RNA-binding protein
MATKLYVGGLAYAVTDDKLKDYFSTIGTVESAQVIIDRSTSQSKGFGFVEMGSAEDAEKAIKELNGKEFEGRSIMVNAARPREERPQSGSFNRDRRPRY